MEADPTGEEAAEIDLTGAEVVDFSLLKLNLQVNLFNNAFVNDQPLEVSDVYILIRYN